MYFRCCVTQILCNFDRSDVFSAAGWNFLKRNYFILLPYHAISHLFVYMNFVCNYYYLERFWVVCASNCGLNYIFGSDGHVLSLIMVMAGWHVFFNHAQWSHLTTVIVVLWKIWRLWSQMLYMYYNNCGWSHYLAHVHSLCQCSSKLLLMSKPYEFKWTSLNFNQVESNSINFSSVHSDGLSAPR